LAIDDIISFFVNVYSHRLLPTPKGIDYRKYPCVMLVAKENFLLPMPVKIDAWRLWFIRVIFIHLQFLPMPNFGVSGEMFWLLILYLKVKPLKSWIFIDSSKL
jgi:hypothetical protein